MFWVYTEQVAWLSPQMPQIRPVARPARDTCLPARTVSPCLLVTGQQFVTSLAPLRLLIGGPRGETAQSADNRPVHRAGRRGHPGPGRLVHEGHELVREPGHRARDTDAAHIRAPTHAVDPATLWHVARVPGQV